MPVTGPPIDGLQALMGKIAGLEERVAKLETQNGRSFRIGNSFSLIVTGSGAAASLKAIKSATGGITTLVP